LAAHTVGARMDSRLRGNDNGLYAQGWDDKQEVRPTVVKIITVDDVKTIIQRKGLEQFFIELIARLRRDFSRWPEFKKTPRLATHFPHGVIELMPICDEQYYAFKYVNGHPYNPQQKKLTVAAIGVLAEVASGYPLLISEMTLLTAIRTAATSALASSYLARPQPQSFAIIGAGSQAEFQILAHHYALGIQRFKYYDKDRSAMAKLAKNLDRYELELIAASDIPSAIAGAEIITTATADKVQATILKDAWINAGVHINAIGGDCPGKTELDPRILSRGKIVVENLEQTQHEGEIQNLPSGKIYAELWEIVSGQKPGRQTPEELFIFDSVGFALEDYTILRYLDDLTTEYSLGHPIHLIPQIDNPKNLFHLLVPSSPNSLPGD